MSDYLYCFRFALDEIRVAKVGVSATPRSRMQTFIPASPFPFVSAHLLKFSSRREADAWERLIITHANRYRAESEWVLDDEKLQQLWDSVTGGEEVDIASTYAGRVISGANEKQSRASAYAERLRARVGQVVFNRVGYDGNPATYDRAIVKARLIEGYGVEDIAILDSLTHEAIRRAITGLRRTGELAAIYRQRTPKSATA